MGRSFRLSLEERLYPVQAYFNAISDRNFIRVLTAFSEGIGSGFESVVCCFPGDLEPEEDMINGIQFVYTLGEERTEVVLPYSDFVKIVREVADGYVQDNPSDTERVESLLNRILNLLANPDSEKFRPGANVIKE